MKQPKVSVVIVTWNGAKYIEDCLNSVLAQKRPVDFKDGDWPWFDILVVDNASNDNTIDIINERYSQKLNLVKNKTNLGFTRGYNQAIHWTSGRYILILNQDVILEKNFLAEACSVLDTYQEVSVVTGTTYKLDPENPQKTRQVDSLGLSLKKNFSFFNLGENDILNSLPTDIRPVFGFSGAVALLRRQALIDVAENKEFFDESFFSYKEDIDLSWRLRRRNWDIVYLPQAIAFHKRSVSAGQDQGFLGILRYYKNKPEFINYLSYRNHLYVLIKNLPGRLFFRYSFYLLSYELMKFFIILFTHPKVLLAWRDIFRKIPVLLNKRKDIKQNSKITSHNIKLWIQ